MQGQKSGLRHHINETSYLQVLIILRAETGAEVSF